MTTRITKLKLGRKGRWSVAAAIVAVGVASASLAVAQAPQEPDGSGGGGGAPITTTCGPNLGSTVITRSSPSTTTAVAPQRLPGAVKTFVIPNGGSRCIKVLFTAETACGPSAASDYCYVQALIDGQPMNPDGAGFQVMDSEDPSASAHAYEWVKHVDGPGQHTVEIEWRVLNAATLFYADDWTMDVQVHQ